MIDESHNLVNVRTRNNALARTLAPSTDALILASATPHNGDAESFAELIKLLDEAAIADPGALRREGPGAPLHPAHQDLPRGARRAQGRVGRPRPLPIRFPPPRPRPNAPCFAELATRWIPSDGPSVSDSRLFPWTLFKSFLSSHRALQETIAKRVKTLDARRRGGHDPAAAELSRPDRPHSPTDRRRRLGQAGGAGGRAAGARVWGPARRSASWCSPSGSPR